MKKIFLFLAVCLLALAVAACSSAPEAPSNDAPGPVVNKLTEIQSKGELVIYNDPNFPPFEFMGANGPEGVDIEIGRAIAAELGVGVVFSESDFDAILVAIQSGRGDIAISGFTITEERKQNVDFSNPYVNSVQYLMLPEGSDIKVLEDLAGKKVGVAFGYTGQFLMEDEIEDGVLEGKNTELGEYPSAMEAASDIKAGRIDAVVMDEYVAKNVANKQGLVAVELRYESGDLASEEYGVVVPKGNEELLEKINAVIGRLIAEDKITQWLADYSAQFSE